MPFSTNVPVRQAGKSSTSACGNTARKYRKYFVLIYLIKRSLNLWKERYEISLSMLAIGLGEKPQEVLTLARCPWFKSFSSQRLGCVCSRLYWYHEQCYVHVTPVRRTRYTLPTMCGAFWVIPGTVGTVTSDTIVYHIGQPGGMQHYGPASKKQIPYCNSCLLYTSPSPRDQRGSRMPSSA